MPKRKPRTPPKPGMVFEKTYHKKRFTLSVVNNGQEIGYKLDKTIYRSPSAAAKSLTKCEVNGWKFWDIRT